MKVSLNPEEQSTLLSLFAGALRRCALYARLGALRPLQALYVPVLFVFSVLFIFLFINRLIHLL